MGGPHIVPRPGRRTGLRAVGSRDDLVSLALPVEGACHRQALRLLQARDIPAVHVKAVYPYGIVFLDRAGDAWTAWTYREERDGGGERLTITLERGLPAFPPDNVGASEPSG